MSIFLCQCAYGLWLVCERVICFNLESHRVSTMPETSRNILNSCISRMLRPITGFCLARGIRFQDFVEIAKENFVASAKDQLDVRGLDASLSRVSAMTGLQRPEVRRLLARKGSKDPKDLITRIVGQWERDRRFLDKRGKPKRLTTIGPSSELRKLVRLVSKDLNPHTVRFELERLGLITMEGDMARLAQVEFIAQGDPVKALQFGAEDVHDLLSAVQENAFISAERPNLHARTQYDNIPDQHLPAIKARLLQLGKQFHTQVRDLLSRFDRDINPSVRGETGRNRVIVGTFSHTHEFNLQSSEPDEEKE